ncbi:hypothetical protein GGTG_07285 [Gaeumannomyces tritici R3-111a-1]|uniref:Uncharacterized protein n=1 Tax=Gaeumannomyces tritici (strain R3-111a-1) TaxID=644352 RepID=J3P188_GAET3|nr:hypothetical protein GGTG_07285 [Gaeumannomyces tritici R3-111a-1]EJT77373.1 hypothetical protein GGTG_07285 [Gaeumannomyces tritici R3-111a-1]
MKTSFVLATLASAVSVIAVPGLSCGHHLVNLARYTQTDLAKAYCGRADTCDGKEWNVLFRIESGKPSVSLYCHLGCWGELGNAQCH